MQLSPRRTIVVGMAQSDSTLLADDELCVVDEGVVQMLLRMLDECHPGLSDHVGDVADLATSCARALDLPRQLVLEIHATAALHDIGKIAIPTAIIAKPGPLSDDEWDFIRGHTVIGQWVLCALPSMQRVGELVRSSHERWDGTGYPDRLAGDDIPIGARIVTVADALRAMTADAGARRTRRGAGARGTARAPRLHGDLVSGADRRRRRGGPDARRSHGRGGSRAQRRRETVAQASGEAQAALDVAAWTHTRSAPSATVASGVGSSMQVTCRSREEQRMTATALGEMLAASPDLIAEVAAWRERECHRSLRVETAAAALGAACSRCSTPSTTSMR